MSLKATILNAMVDKEWQLTTAIAETTGLSIKIVSQNINSYASSGLAKNRETSKASHAMAKEWMITPKGIKFAKTNIAGVIPYGSYAGTALSKNRREAAPVNLSAAAELTIGAISQLVEENQHLRSTMQVIYNQLGNVLNKEDKNGTSS